MRGFFLRQSKMYAHHAEPFKKRPFTSERPRNMPLFPPPPLPPEERLHEPTEQVVVMPLRDPLWGRRIFRAPDLALPNPATYQANFDALKRFKGKLRPSA